jgi:ABC-type phosphate transport system permease subunit
MPRPAFPPGQLHPLSVPVTRATRRFSNWGDRLLLLALWLCAAVAGLVTLLIVTYVCAQSVPFLREIGVTRLFTDPSWAPTQGLFNLLPMLVGSLYVTLGAVSIASILGVGLAIFDTFYAPTAMARVVRGTLSLLAGIPSVVYGLWGLTVLVPLLNRAYPPGFSLLLGILVLTIMILPTIALLADAALQAVPQEYVFGAAALGCTRWVRRSLELLAGVPSIVCGLFGLAFFGEYLGWGWSILSGGMTLACMILPLLIRSAEESLRAVPQSLRHGAAALGLSKRAELWHLTLPAAVPGITAGLVLSIGRALAETAALLFTAGSAIRMPESWFDSARALSYHS